MELKGKIINFLGDSITQGCFEFFRVGDGFDTVFDRESSYPSHLSRLLAERYPRAAVNIVNAGISGDNSLGGLRRLESDVIRFSPDLTVVCFALNDSMAGMDGLEKFKDNVRSIVKALKDSGGEVIVLTPNMMPEHPSPLVTDSVLGDLAKTLSELQRNGVVDAYVEAEIEAGRESGAVICDVYAEWKRMARDGRDIESLLANRINHPTREMQKLFATSLLDVMCAE